jgi:hypothetical protein
MNVNSKALPGALESRRKLRLPNAAPAETFAYGAHWIPVGVLLREAAIPMPGAPESEAPGKPGWKGKTRRTCEHNPGKTTKAENRNIAPELAQFSPDCDYSLPLSVIHEGRWPLLWVYVTQ